MLKRAQVTVVALVVLAMALWAVPDAAAVWWGSDIYFDGYGVEAYSITLRQEWDTDQVFCDETQIDPDTQQEYCSRWVYYALWVSLSASLSRPSGSIAASGADWSVSAADLYFYVPADQYGNWTMSGAHFVGIDVSLSYCTPTECTPWLYAGNEYWFLDYSSASTNVQPPPGEPGSPFPGHGAVNVLTILTMTWSASGATFFDVALGTTNPPPLVVQNLGSAAYSPPTLSPGTLYYWKVTARNAVGSSEGPVWSFTTAVGTPTNPTPANGATNVGLQQTLTWSASGATSYDIAFGTANPPPTVATNVSTASYAPPPPLNSNTIYFWKVTAKRGGSSTVGPVWSFTTGAGAIYLTKEYIRLGERIIAIESPQ